MRSLSGASLACVAVLALGSVTSTVACAKVGERLRVVTICPDCPECMRLRELGFQDRMEVRKVSDGAASICSIMGIRVAIGRDLGEHVRVEKIAA